MGEATPICGVIGAGGHAKSVVATLISAGRTVSACFDFNPALWGGTVCGVDVLGAPSDAASFDGELILGIGDNRTRRKLADEFRGRAWARAIHVAAWCDPRSEIGEGSFVGAKSVLHVDAVLGRHVIVNTGAIIEHDCRLGSFCHVAPGGQLAGAVSLGEGVFVGIGASVLPGVSVGDWATVGAGAVVRNDVAAGSVVVGVPARRIR